MYDFSRKSEPVLLPTIYRPSKTPKLRVVMNDSPPSPGGHTELHDAVTGELLEPGMPLFQCGTCKAYYRAASIIALGEKNNGLCISCLSTDIAPLLRRTGPTLSILWRDLPADAYSPASTAMLAVPELVTLRDYHDFQGRMVTFRGYVYRVDMMGGRGYAALFEDKPWYESMKMVVINGSIRRAGGGKFLRSLADTTVTVRGLLTRHRRFGDQLVPGSQDGIIPIRSDSNFHRR